MLLVHTIIYIFIYVYVHIDDIHFFQVLPVGPMWFLPRLARISSSTHHRSHLGTTALIQSPMIGRVFTEDVIQHGHIVPKRLWCRKNGRHWQIGRGKQALAARTAHNKSRTRRNSRNSGATEILHRHGKYCNSRTEIKRSSFPKTPPIPGSLQRITQHSFSGVAQTVLVHLESLRKKYVFTYICSRG